MKQTTTLHRVQRLRRLVGRLQSDRRRGAAPRLVRLRTRLQRLLRRLVHRAVLAPATAAALLAAPLGASAQQITFAPPTTSPFGLASGADLVVPAYADIDGDGDLDIMGVSYQYDTETSVFILYENTGTPSEPQFAAPVTNTFNLDVADLETPLWSAIADLDGDGDLDVLITEYADDYSGVPYSFAYFENVGSTTAPDFGAPVENPFGLEQATSMVSDILTPIFADLDNDGDNDLLLGDYDLLVFVENTGTPAAPAFGAPKMSPFGIQTPSDGLYYVPSVADLDQDGDLDLVLSSYSELFYFENTGTPEQPIFGAPAPDALDLDTDALEGILLGGFADLDGDGDEDLLFAEYYDAITWVFYENQTPPVATRPLPADFRLELGPVPAATTVDMRSNYALRDLTLYDALGRPVLRARDGAAQLDVRELTPGVYRFEAFLADGSRATRSLSVVR